MPETNLPELRDIHLPEGVSPFPPAYGWWVILAAVLGLTALVWLILFLRRKSKKLYALYLLNNIHGSSLVAAATEMSAILRRICVFKYKEAAVLSGDEWLKFLNAKTKQPLSGKAAELLLEAPYVPAESACFAQGELIRLRQFCQSWIGENL